MRWKKIIIIKFVYSSIKLKVMKIVKLKTIQKQITNGRVECITDLKIGYVSIRRFPSRKTEMVEVVK